MLASHLEGVYRLQILFPEWQYLIAMFTDYAYQAVIAFFLLSGFSIHHSNQQRNLATAKGLNRYYFLRFRRIYPIFLYAVLLTLVLAAVGCELSISQYCKDLSHISPGYLVLNLLFLADRDYIPGALSPVLPGNSPLWSLSYEVVYYIIYPVIWLVYARLGNIAALWLGIIVSMLAIVVTWLGHPNHFSNVLGLYFLWCLGAWAPGLPRCGKIITGFAGRHGYIC